MQRSIRMFLAGRNPWIFITASLADVSHCFIENAQFPDMVLLVIHMKYLKYTLCVYYVHAVRCYLVRIPIFGKVELKGDVWDNENWAQSWFGDMGDSVKGLG